MALQMGRRGVRQVRETAGLIMLANIRLQWTALRAAAEPERRSANEEARMADGKDPYELSRFVQAQAEDYEQALSEIRAGRKRSHWMWYIFPQFDGLGFSSTARRYAIKSIAEVEAYLRHPVLGPRLVECCEAVVGVNGRSAYDMFGSPDDMKLRSCATLFERVSAPGSVFERLLGKYFEGVPDERTLFLAGVTPEAR